MRFVFANCAPRPWTVSLPVVFPQNPVDLQLGTGEDNQSFEEVKRTHQMPVCSVYTSPIKCLFTRFVLQSPTALQLGTEDNQSFKEVKRTLGIHVCKVCTTPINCLFTRFVLQNPTDPLLSTEEDDPSFEEVKRTHQIPICYVCTTPTVSLPILFSRIQQIHCWARRKMTLSLKRYQLFTRLCLMYVRHDN